MGRLLNISRKKLKVLVLLLSSSAMTPDFVNAPPKATHDFNITH